MQLTKRLCCVNFLLCLVVLSLLPKLCYAGGGPQNVLVVANTLSDVSRRIAFYYQQARGIPSKNILFISCPTTEKVNKDTCENLIRKPIHDYLATSSMSDIEYIVVCKGVPLTADYGDSSGVYSVTSILTCVANPLVKDPTDNPYGPVMLPNGSWGPGPEIYWSGKHSFVKSRLYNVTRLDAYIISDVYGMIDDAVRPLSTGVFVLDKAMCMKDYYAVANDLLGPGTGSAYALLQAKNANVTLDQTSTFVNNTSGIMGYFSWGSNDASYTYSKYMSNRFLPGSIGDTFYSFSARTFTDPGTPTRGSLIADLFQNGLCGACGYVSEPYISTATFPNFLFDRYTKGYNMAESFFASTNILFWKSTVVGDPLMAPFATPPRVQLIGLDAPVTGKTALLQATAADASGIAKVEFYVDDTLVGTSTTAPYQITFDSTAFIVGSHTVKAIAYENSTVYTQGFTLGTLDIENDLSKLEKISQAFQYDDGQRVRLVGKLVVASGGTVPGGFYIEELDRSAGILVKSLTTVSEGTLVDVEGTVSTINGERALIDAIISPSAATYSTSSLSIKPLGMKNSAMGGYYAGKYTSGWTNGRGLMVSGLLIKTYGVVTYIGTGWFNVDDGSRRIWSGGLKGVKVYSTSSLPPLYSWVTVTGVCGSENSSGDIVPVIRTRRDTDVVVQKLQVRPPGGSPPIKRPLPTYPMLPKYPPPPPNGFVDGADTGKTELPT